MGPQVQPQNDPAKLDVFFPPLPEGPLVRRAGPGSGRKSHVPIAAELVEGADRRPAEGRGPPRGGGVEVSGDAAASGRSSRRSRKTSREVMEV